MRNLETQQLNTLIVGASGGIGGAFVRQLLADNSIATVCATYRRRESASTLLTLENQYPDKLTCFPLDTTQEEQIVEVVQKLSASIEKLHLVINCVGILHEGELQPEKSLRQLNAEHLLRYFQVNSIGTALLAKHLLPLLRHGDRSIFAAISAKIGSIGDNRLGGWYGYRASKAALNMLLRTIAIEYRRKTPRTIVTALHPGTTDTQLSEPFQKNVPAEKLFSVERCATQLLAVIDGLEENQSGQFFSWDGQPLPW
ncbi:MAG: SDR family NAD(P)-dependent oxidoreductase [Cyanobacteriota bacterium]|nr:SDR family NAD(P)-dependent oxidoreductase [Cyanobacteriota bacterium]